MSPRRKAILAAAVAVGALSAAIVYTWVDAPASECSNSGSVWPQIVAFAAVGLLLVFGRRRR